MRAVLSADHWAGRLVVDLVEPKVELLAGHWAGRLVADLVELRAEMLAGHLAEHSAGG